MKEYTPSQFTHKDFKHLASVSPYHLRDLLRESKYRDKGIQRVLRKVFYKEADVLICPLNQIPLYIENEAIWIREIAKWRLSINR